MLNKTKIWIIRILCILLVLRIFHILYGRFFWFYHADFKTYVSITSLYLQGIDMQAPNFDKTSIPENGLYGPVFPEMISPLNPALTYLIQAFNVFGESFGNYFYYFLNNFLAFTLIPMSMYFSKIKLAFNLQKPNWTTLLNYSCLFLFITSQTTLITLHLGQLSIIITWLIYLSIFLHSETLKGALLGVATTLKFTMIPLVFPLLALHRYYKGILVSGIVIIFFAITPYFMSLNLIDVYTNYFQSVKYGTEKYGFDTFEFCVENCPRLLQFNFINSFFINTTFKSTMLFIYFLSIIKYWRQKIIGWNLLLFTFSLTMNIVYHGLHDFVLVLPALLMNWRYSILNKEWIHLAIFTIFVLFYNAKIIQLEPIAIYIASIVPKNLFFTGNTEPATFPLNAFMTALLTVYSAYRVMFTKENKIPI